MGGLVGVLGAGAGVNELPGAVTIANLTWLSQGGGTTTWGSSYTYENYRIDLTGLYGGNSTTTWFLEYQINGGGWTVWNSYTTVNAANFSPQPMQQMVFTKATLFVTGDTLTFRTRNNLGSTNSNTITVP